MNKAETYITEEGGFFFSFLFEANVMVVGSHCFIDLLSTALKVISWVNAKVEDDRNDNNGIRVLITLSGPRKIRCFFILEYAHKNLIKVDAKFNLSCFYRWVCHSISRLSRVCASIFYVWIDVSIILCQPSSCEFRYGNIILVLVLVLAGLEAAFIPYSLLC